MIQFMQTSTAVGISLGSQAIVIGVAKKGGVEIMANEGSHRETPFVVGFGPSERFCGEQGAAQLKSNFKNTIVYPLRFLGMKGDSPHLGQETKFLYNKTVTMPDNKMGFSVNYGDELRTFLPEQVVAGMLEKVKDITRKNEVDHSEFVLTVPSYFTEQERRALLDAAKLADIKVVRLMNEHVAISLAYGIFRKADLDSNPRNVLFVDIGHSSTSVFLSSFTKDKVSIVDQYHERHLGCRDIDWIVLDFYANLFNRDNGINPIKNDKARLRLLDAIEKQRKVLSANSEASVNLEFLLEDCDLNHSMSREQYEQMITPVVNRIKETLSRINTSKYTIHSVEIVGGATRIPLIQKVIQEVYSKPLSKTLNTTECIARGAAIQAAILSPSFKVADYGLEESNFYPIRCSWKFMENIQAREETKMDVEDTRNNPIKQRSILFDIGCKYPSVKAISFHKTDAVEFKLFYDPVPIGAEEMLATYVIHNPKPQLPDFKVKLRVHLNRSGIIEFDSSQLLEEWEEEELPATKDGEKKEENAANTEPPKKKRKSRSSDLPTDILFRHGLSEGEIEKFMGQETQMAAKDRLIMETYNKRNELESYIYDCRGKVTNKYKGVYLDHERAETLLALLTQTEDWLYNEGFKATKDAYSSKLETLKKMADPAHTIVQEYENIPGQIQDLMALIDNVDQTLAQGNTKLAHVTAEERKPALDLASQTKAWAYNALTVIDKAQKTQRSPITITEVQQKFHELQSKATPLMNKPVPQIPKDQMKDEKAEAPVIEENSDSKMDIEK